MDRIDQPQNERSRRTRAAILDATWALLEEQGAENLTMAAVARRAGVSRRAIYLHFPTRTDLLFSLHGHINEALDVRASTRTIYDAPDSVAALDAFVAHTVTIHWQLRRVVQAVDRARRTDPDAAALWARAMDGWLAGCRQVSERLQAEGILAQPWTIDTAADLLWTLMSVDLLEDLIEDRGWPQEDCRGRLTILTRRTLVKPESQSLDSF